jgi:hypothetical protein
VLITTPRITVAEVVVPISLRPTCVRFRHRRVATASAASPHHGAASLRPRARLASLAASRHAAARLESQQLPAAGSTRGGCDRDVRKARDVDHAVRTSFESPIERRDSVRSEPEAGSSGAGMTDRSERCVDDRAGHRHRAQAMRYDASTCSNSGSAALAIDSRATTVIFWRVSRTWSMRPRYFAFGFLESNFSNSIRH